MAIKAKMKVTHPANQLLADNHDPAFKRLVSAARVTNHFTVSFILNLLFPFNYDFIMKNHYIKLIILGKSV